MMIPTVHLNGTGSKNLLDEIKTAHTALMAAMVALRQVTVHGRDYYPQGPSAYTQARHEMDARLSTLEKILDDLEAMHVAIRQQVR